MDKTDFKIAWEAYESGKTIQSEYWLTFRKCDRIKKDDEKHHSQYLRSLSFTPEEIRGEWFILD